MVWFRPAVRRAPFIQRLPRNRLSISYGGAVQCAPDVSEPVVRSAPADLADRHPVRPRSQADRLGGSAAGRAVPRRSTAAGVPACCAATDRDAVAGVQWRRGEGFRFDHVRTRTEQWREAWLGLAGLTLGVSLCSEQAPVDLEQRYPAGSITTAALAEQALADAAATRETVDARYKAESARCAHVFLATECQDKARRAHTLGQTQAHRVEVEAHDLQRKLAAQRRASERDVQQQQLRQQEAERPKKERQAQNAAQQRADRTKERTQDA